MTVFKTARDGLAGTAAVALIVAACAWPAAAQTNTTPSDNGANCSGTGANQANCAHNENSTGTTPGSGSGANNDGTDNNNVDTGVTPPSGSGGTGTGSGTGGTGGTGGSTGGTGSGGTGSGGSGGGSSGGGSSGN